MTIYNDIRASLLARFPDGVVPGGVAIDDIAQLKMQNTWDTHLDIARAMAKIMREDMAAYDADNSRFTQSLGCWSGFHAQQMIRAVRRRRGGNRGAYVYLSGWMVAALRNRFGHLPDQSMHEKTAVVDLIDEIYASLRQADEVELNELFARLRQMRAEGAKQAAIDDIIAGIDNFESHVVPMIADIDAGFGNEHATYLLAKQMIRAGACCIQIENQVSDAKQCGHQDGKVTVPREDFIEKLRAVRLAFEELGVEDGVIIARTDSLGAGLTQKVPVSAEPDDMAANYIKWLDSEAIDAGDLKEGEMAIKMNGSLKRPVRLANGLFKFRPDTGSQRAIEDCIASLNEGGADMIWIETAVPSVDEIAALTTEIRKSVPNAKLAYNNSPSFNWTLNMRRQVRADWLEAGKITANDYPETKLMSAEIDADELALEADRRTRDFQQDLAQKAGVFHNLITLPSFHMTAKGMDELSRAYFGDDMMLAYVASIQREEIRRGVSAVRHQREVGSALGDSFKEMVARERALKAGGSANTMHQFAAG